MSIRILKCLFNYFDIIEVNAQKVVNAIPPLFLYNSLIF